MRHGSRFPGWRCDTVAVMVPDIFDDSNYGCQFQVMKRGALKKLKITTCTLVGIAMVGAGRPQLNSSTVGSRKWLIQISWPIVSKSFSVYFKVIINICF